MAKRELAITRHGNTIRIQAGRYVESFDAMYKDEEDIVDACLWLALSGNISASEETIRELLRENRVIA